MGVAAVARRALGCVIAVAAVACAARAQILFEPGTLTLDVDCGKPCVADVKVTNAGNAADATVELELKQPGPCRSPLAEWAAVSPARLHLPRGGSQTVRISFSKKAPTAQGECVLALFVGEEIRGQVPLRVRTGMPVYVRLNGETRAEGRIAAVEHQLRKNGELELAFTVHNQGKLHLMPFGLAWIENADGARLWQVELKPNEPVFPEQQRMIAWKGALPPEIRRDGVLHLQMFWGTLYDFARVGQPKSAAVQVALKDKAATP